MSPLCCHMHNYGNDIVNSNLMKLNTKVMKNLNVVT